MNQLVDEYTSHLQLRNIQVAYKGILQFIGKVRANLIKKYPNDPISRIYPDYLDMMYFSLTKEPFPKRLLKLK